MWLDPSSDERDGGKQRRANHRSQGQVGYQGARVSGQSVSIVGSTLILPVLNASNSLRLDRHSYHMDVLRTKMSDVDQNISHKEVCPICLALLPFDTKRHHPVRVPLCQGLMSELVKSKNSWQMQKQHYENKISEMETEVKMVQSHR